MTSQHWKGSEKRSPTKVVSFGRCKNCRGTCTNTIKLPLERLHYSQFCLSCTVVITCKESSSDEKQQSIVHYNDQVLQHIRHNYYYYYSVAKKKLHRRKVQQWKKERKKKRSFSPPVLHAQQNESTIMHYWWLAYRASSTFTPFEKKQKTETTSDRNIFSPLLLSIVSKYSRSHTHKTNISVPIVGVRQPHLGKCYGRN